MKTATVSLSAGNAILLPLLLGIVIVVIANAALTGKTLPLIATPRSALIAILIVGMIMCMGGIGQVGVSGKWASPLAILGYLLGAAILLAFAAGMFGWKLPFVSGEKDAILAMTSLIAVKYVIGVVGFFLRLL